MPKKLDAILDPIGDSEWSNDYWDSLFQPLRRFLLRRIAYIYRQLHRDEIADATDEVILRLFKNFEFARLAEVPREKRRLVFYGFVKQTVRSVIADIYRQKGFTPPEPKSKKTVLHNISAGIVAQAFDSLTSQEQEILRLRIFQKLSYNEIQARCTDNGEPPAIGALKMRASRATAALRKRIVSLAAGGE